MSPFSAPVLGGAALLTTPAVWNVLHGVSPTSVALGRFLIAIALCWLALEIVTAAVGPTPRADSREPAEVGSEGLG